ncbi:MAG: hypothetical protein KAV42_08345 [Candidatus Krumholzibacteria bacterium]|nr:hypothetical protein [Candidatus Krumholzibacteria bacterium]
MRFLTSLIETKNSSRSLLLFSLLLAFLVVFVSPAAACWMELKVVDGDKETLAPGDTVTVLFSLTLTHGNCHLEITDTEFHASGAEIIAATKWKRLKDRPVVVERKMMVLLKEDGSNGAVTLTAERICDRMGGRASLEFIPDSRKTPGTKK